MFPARSIQRWNSLLVPPVGFLLNFLFIWLVLRKTPKEMRVHSRILLQTCFLDILYLCLLTIGSAAVPVEGVWSMLIYDGYLVKFLVSCFGMSSLYYHYQVFLFFYFFDSYSVAVQFLYRYLVLNRNVKVCLVHYLLMLSVPFCVSLLLNILLISTSKYQIMDRQSLGPNVVNGLLDGPLDEQFIASENQFTSYYVLEYPSHFFFFAIMVFCGWRMVKFVNEHSSLNTQLKNLNRQLTRNLIILGLISALPCVVDTAFLLMGLSTDKQEDKSMTGIVAINCFCYWGPLLNPVGSILTNKPYRQAVAALLCCRPCRKKNNATVAVAVVVVPAK